MNQHLGLGVGGGAPLVASSGAEGYRIGGIMLPQCRLLCGTRDSKRHTTGFGCGFCWSAITLVCVRGNDDD